MAVAWSTPEIIDKIVGDNVPNQYFILYSVNALKLGNRLKKYISEFCFKWEYLIS